MEEETKGRNMLPTSFLRQLIGFYGDSMQGLVPEFLERMMEQFAAQQAEVRASVERTVQALVPVGNPAALEAIGREAAHAVATQNVAVIDRATPLYSPYYRPGQESAAPGAASAQPARPASDSGEILALREEIARLREELAQASASLAETPLRSLARGGARH